MLLRTDEMEDKYRDYRAQMKDVACFLCTAKPLKEFKYWKILLNNFPYDKIAETHHMIMPLRHVIDREITKEEWQELLDIRAGYIEENYDFILDAVTKSIPLHFHLHLIVPK